VRLRPCVSDLLGDAGERRVEARWAHLGELNRDDAPRSLHTELEPERSCRKPAERVGQDPKRDKGTCKQNANDDGETATDVLRCHRPATQ